MSGLNSYFAMIYYMYIYNMGKKNFSHKYIYISVKIILGKSMKKWGKKSSCLVPQDQSDD